MMVARLAVILTTVCGFGLTTAAEPKSQTSIQWKTDLKAAQKEAKETGRPMIVVFGADWCAYCDRFEKSTLGEPKTAEAINRDFVPVLLDFDDEQKIAAVMEVEALPCTVLLSPEADLLGRVVGAKSPRELRTALEKAKNEHVRIRHARLAAAQDDRRN